MATLVTGLGGSSGYGENKLARNSSASVSIDITSLFNGGLNFYGQTFTSLTLDDNGLVIFGTAFDTFVPEKIQGVSSTSPFIAPFWADVDTDPGFVNPGTGDRIWYDLDAASHTFTATWDRVGYYQTHLDKTNSFQLRLIAVGNKGDFDIQFIYQDINWTTGDFFNHGSNGLGGNIARAGYMVGVGSTGKSVELSQSGTSAMLDLENASNVGQPGMFVFQIRNGGSLFTSDADTVDFNNLTGAQKAAITAGSDPYHGLGGSDTVTLPTTGNYHQVVGKDKSGNDILLDWTERLGFATGSMLGDIYTLNATTGNHTIVAGAGTDNITIKGDGDNKITGGSGTTNIEITIGTGNGGTNTIIGGTGTTNVTLKGPSAVKAFGFEDIYAAAGHTSITLDIPNTATIYGGATAATSATIDLIAVKQPNEYVVLEGFSTVTSLQLATDAKIILAQDAVANVAVVKNTDGTLNEPGSIQLGLESTLELRSLFNGTVEMGVNGTLILDQPSKFGFNPAQTLSADIGKAFHVEVGLSGDTIVLKGLNAQTEQVNSASIGEVTLKDGVKQLALHLVLKPTPSSSDFSTIDIALEMVAFVSYKPGSYYFDVSESADGKDTVLKLMDGSGVGDAMRVAEAYWPNGILGGGVKIGIISDSFASDAAAYALDISRGFLPTVTVLSDGAGKDEGRAMAQIVHQIAPYAQLYFAAAGSVYTFSSVIDSLRAAGVDIIVDDVGFTRLGEWVTGLNSTIHSVARSGITYVTAAGNDRPSVPVFGHAASPDAISVAAVNLLAAPSTAQPFGHYLPAATEPFSSVGANGKPDVSGPDRGQTSLPLGGLNPFYGTSASAPAVAGVVALMMDANPLLRANPRQVEQILESTALAFGDASTAGAGFVQADKAVAAAALAKENFFNAPGGSPPPPDEFALSGVSAPAEAITPSPPHPTSAALSQPSGAAATGQTVLMMVIMSEGVIVTGAPSFSLNSGGLATYDAAISNPTAGRLLFDIAIAAGQHATSLTLTGFNGTVKNSGGSAVDFSALFGVGTGLTINSSLSISSFGTSSSTAQAGETIDLTVTLSGGATLDTKGGKPTLTLSDGATATYDAAKSNPAAGKLVFDYKVGAGEQTADLAISSINLPSGTTLHDASGNNADFSAAIDHNMGVQVGPAFVQVVGGLVEQTAVATDQTVQLTVGFSQGVLVDTSKGSPTLVLSNGGVATYDGPASTPATGALVFDYKVGASDKATNLLVTTLNLNGATIKDSHGAAVDLGGAANASTALTVNSPLKVGSLAPSQTGTIHLGDSVQLTITLAASFQMIDANSGGSPTLGLNDGGMATFNTLFSDPATGKLVFDYKVGAGETTSNLAITQFNQNGAIVFDKSGNFADFSGAIGLPTGLQVVDSVPSVATIAAGASTKAEGNSGTTAFTFTVTLDHPLEFASATLAYAVTGSGANPASAADFGGGVLPSGAVTFLVGESSKTVTVNVQGDEVVESNEDFAVTLGNPSSGLTITTASAVGTIGNDDAKVSITATSATKAEGNADTTAFTFMISRSGAISVSHSVSWSVTGSGANPATASDFSGGVLPSGGVTFAVGETAKVVTVNVQGDTAAEAGEEFTVALSGLSSGLSLGTAAAIGTILNDDLTVLVAHDDAFVTQQGKAVVATAATGLLYNDDGATTASIVTGAGHGTLQFTSNGAFTYTPVAGFKGVDSFTYKAGNGGGDTETAEAFVYVVPVIVGASTTLDLLALTANEQIAATYAAFFGRAADSTGFAFWVGEFNRGLPIQGPVALFTNIASSFGVSTEAKALYPFLVNPFAASDAQISAFIDSVYNNLFNRGSDAAGLGYWTGQVKATLAAGQFVGSVLVNIMSGAQDTADGKDITTLMGKVAVSLAYVREQQEHNTIWAGTSDTAAATNLLHAVTSDAQSVLVGIRSAETLIAAHA